MNQKYKKLQEELQLMMNTMAANTFLLPSTWSDEQQSSSEDVRYKTYCNDRRDYVSIDVTVGKSVTIYLSGGIWDVTVAGRLFNMKSQSSQIMESMRTPNSHFVELLFVVQGYHVTRIKQGVLFLHGLYGKEGDTLE